MASPNQMVTKSLFIAISIFVVTSQDIFGQPVFSRACYGTYGDQCANTDLSCGTDENVLIIDIVYKGKEIACRGICTQEACCDGEQNISEENILHLNKMETNEACSGKQSCTLLSPNYALKTSGRVTSIEVDYYCIENRKLINYCEKIKQTDKTVHIMYNGQTDHYVNRDCYCSIHADYDIDLYSVDIRLQKQDSTSPQCTNTTLKWGYNQTETVEKCLRSDDHSRFRKLIATKDMWVQLSIQDENPTMVWIAAKAISGKVNVTCGQRNVNTQVTTSTLSTTSHNTTINTKTQNISSAITSKSDSVSTTVTGPAMLPTVSKEETNIGAIVGPVVGTILLVVVVVIGIIVWRRRARETCSKKKGDTDDQSYENAPPTIQLSGISNVSHAYENTPGTVQHYEQLRPYMDTNEYQSIGKIDQQQLDQENAAYVNQGENDTKMVLEMSGGDGDRNNEEQNYYSSIQDDNKVSHREDGSEYYNTKDRCVNAIHNLDDLSKMK